MENLVSTGCRTCTGHRSSVLAAADTAIMALRGLGDRAIVGVWCRLSRLTRKRRRRLMDGFIGRPVVSCLWELSYEVEVCEGNAELLITNVGNFCWCIEDSEVLGMCNSSVGAHAETGACE